MKKYLLLIQIFFLVSCHHYINFPKTHQITGFTENNQSLIGISMTPGLGGDIFFARSFSKKIGLTSMASLKRSNLADEQNTHYSYELGLLFFKQFKPIRFESNIGVGFSNFMMESSIEPIEPSDDRLFKGKVLSLNVQPSATVDFKYLELSLSTKLRYLRLRNLEGNLGGSLQGYSVPEIQAYNPNHYILEPGLTLTYKYKRFRLMFQGVVDVYLMKNAYLHGKNIGPTGFGGIAYTF